MYTHEAEKLLLKKEFESWGKSSRRKFNIEYTMSRQEKIEHIDSVTNGGMTQLIEFIKKFNNDKNILPKSVYGYSIKTNSLKAWIKRNNPNNEKIRFYNDGLEYCFLGLSRRLSVMEDNLTLKGDYYTYEDIVEECFHRLLLQYLKEENGYFNTHDEYEVAATKLKELIEKYPYNGIFLWISPDITVHEVDNNTYSKSRKLTIEEVNMLLKKYEEVEAYYMNAFKDIHITY